MSLKVITEPAKLTNEMDVQLLFLIKTANEHISQVADHLRKSKINQLDPKDGREAIITLSVDPKTGSVTVNRRFNFSK